MKKTIAFVIVLAMALALAACQTTPENPIIVGKGDRQLEGKISSQAEALIPEDMPESGTRVSETYRHKSLNITIEVDALVELPESDRMPAAKVTPYKFTQDDVNRVLDYFAGNARFFQIPENENWDMALDQDIKRAETDLAYLRANPNVSLEHGRYWGYAHDDVIAALERELADCYKWRAAAKPSSAFPDATRILGPTSDDDKAIAGAWENDGFGYTLRCYNNGSGKNGALVIRRLDACNLEENNLSSFRYRFPESVSILEAGQSIEGLSYADALATAKQAIAAVTGEHMGLASAKGVVAPAETGIASCYFFIFTHEVNGVLCRFSSIGMAYDQNQYDEVWDTESMMISVDKSGIVSFAWYCPAIITEELSGGVPLLTFAEVIDVFSKMAFIKNSYWESEVKADVRIVDGAPEIGTGKGDIKANSMTIRIEKITLGLMRVQSGREYLLIPVWDFYGYKEVFCEDGSNFYERAQMYYMLENLREPLNILTINAIDGSVIDRNYGY